VRALRSIFARKETVQTQSLVTEETEAPDTAPPGNAGRYELISRFEGRLRGTLAEDFPVEDFRVSSIDGLPRHSRPSRHSLSGSLGKQVQARRDVERRRRMKLQCRLRERMRRKFWNDTGQCSSAD
jgi:hypothetical protein